MDRRQGLDQASRAFWESEWSVCWEVEIGWLTRRELGTLSLAQGKGQRPRVKRWDQTSLLTQAYAILCPKAWNTFAIGN